MFFLSSSAFSFKIQFASFFVLLQLTQTFVNFLCNEANRYLSILWCLPVSSDTPLGRLFPADVELELLEGIFSQICSVIIGQLSYFETRSGIIYSFMSIFDRLNFFSLLVEFLPFLNTLSKRLLLFRRFLSTFV